MVMVESGRCMTKTKMHTATDRPSLLSARVNERTAFFVALHESAVGIFCCKSPKLSGDNFPAIRRSNPRAPIFVASAALARSLTSLSSGDEVPHIFTRKSRLQPGEFWSSVQKRVLQQYLPGPDFPHRNTDVRGLR